MNELPSRLYSSSTLLRGTSLIRGATMTLEGDEEYQKMVAERDRLLEAQQNTLMFIHVSVTFYS